MKVKELKNIKIKRVNRNNPFFLSPYRPDTFFYKNIEKCRLLKIKLKSKKVISFGFFLEEEEARKIIKAIKESKINYEKLQEEIKEFQNK